MVKTVESILKDRNAYGATFYEIGEHVPVAGIKAGVRKFKEAGADVIVSIGGGSPVDASKAILYHLQGESGGAYFNHIAIPTTLSAAEYSVSITYSHTHVPSFRWFVTVDTCATFRPALGTRTKRDIRSRWPPRSLLLWASSSTRN